MDRTVLSARNVQEVMVLCSWLSPVPLFVQEYNWAVVNCGAIWQYSEGGSVDVTFRWTSLPSRGKGNFFVR